jgi:hypothetical protein
MSNGIFIILKQLKKQKKLQIVYMRSFRFPESDVNQLAKRINNFVYFFLALDSNHPCSCALFKLLFQRPENKKSYSSLIPVECYAKHSIFSSMKSCSNKTATINTSTTLDNQTQLLVKQKRNQFLNIEEFYVLDSTTNSTTVSPSSSSAPLAAKTSSYFGKQVDAGLHSNCTIIVK